MQQPLQVKKTALRDVQNENRLPNSQLPKFCGAKRPSPVSLPTGSSANPHLVYVRRKSDAETGKGSICEADSINGDCLNSKQLDHQDMKEPKVSCLKGTQNLNWEERYHQLQSLLKKLGESDQEDYLQMLRSLSSVELSRHAVELEKRSIQLSLEEAKEVQRVQFMNILGKTMKDIKASTTCQGQPKK